jgi:hypothetical protein
MSQYGLAKLVPGKRGSVAPEVLVREVQMDLSIVGLAVAASGTQRSTIVAQP